MTTEEFILVERLLNLSIPPQMGSSASVEQVFILSHFSQKKVVTILGNATTFLSCVIFYSCVDAGQ